MFKNASYQLVNILRNLGIQKPLYHGTHFYNIRKILSQGFDASAGHGDAYGEAVCFSRSFDYYAKNPALKWSWNKQDIIFVLDEREVQSRFKTSPYNWHYHKLDNKDKFKHNKRLHEFETRVYATKIPAKYIKAIITKNPIKMNIDVPIIYRTEEGFSLQESNLNVNRRKTHTLLIELAEKDNMEDFLYIYNKYGVSDIEGFKDDLLSLEKFKFLDALDLEYNIEDLIALTYEGYEYVRKKLGLSKEQAFNHVYTESYKPIYLYDILKEVDVPEDIAEDFFYNTSDPRIIRLLKDKVDIDIHLALEKADLEVLKVADIKQEDLEGIEIKSGYVVELLLNKGLVPEYAEYTFTSGSAIPRWIDAGVKITNPRTVFIKNYDDPSVVKALQPYLNPDDINVYRKYGIEDESIVYFSKFKYDFEDIDFLFTSDISLDLFKAFYRPEFFEDIFPYVVYNTEYDKLEYMLSQGVDTQRIEYLLKGLNPVVSSILEKYGIEV